MPGAVLRERTRTVSNSALRKRNRAVLRKRNRTCQILPCESAIGPSRESAMGCKLLSHLTQQKMPGAVLRKRTRTVSDSALRKRNRAVLRKRNRTCQNLPCESAIGPSRESAMGRNFKSENTQPKKGVSAGCREVGLLAHLDVCTPTFPLVASKGVCMHVCLIKCFATPTTMGLKLRATPPANRLGESNG
jgi:uncharacterized protein YecT (DUF1311 family)